MKHLSLAIFCALAIFSCQKSNKFKSEDKTGQVKVGKSVNTNKSSTVDESGGLPTSPTPNATIDETIAKQVPTAPAPAPLVPLPQTVSENKVMPTSSTVVDESCQDKPQKILLADFKSGWFEDMYYKDIAVIFKEAVKGSCAIEIQVDYHHFQASHQPGLNLGLYTQIWIFSGSDKDLMNGIKPNDPWWLDFVKQVKNSKIPLFLGAGSGAVEHVNMIGKSLIGKDLFAVSSGAGYSSPVDPRTVNAFDRITTSKLGMGVFSGITKPLANAVVTVGTIEGQKVINSMTADSISLSESDYEELARCGLYKADPEDRGTMPEKVLPCIGMAEMDGRRVILDSDLARLYLVVNKQDHADTKRYIFNIARMLAN